MQQEPETEAVSDEELPVAAAADLGETESVSEDELPPDGDKKRKGGAKAQSKAAAESAKAKPEGGTGVNHSFNRLMKLFFSLFLSFYFYYNLFVLLSS